MLSLLINVSKLVIYHPWLHPLPPQASALLDALALEAFRPGGEVFSRLTDVEATSFAPEPTSFQQLNVFFALPSVRKVLCTRYTATLQRNFNLPFNWRYPHLQSQLGPIELLSCSVTAPELEKLLPHLQRLKCFKLHATRGDEPGVGGVLQALEDHCAATLTTIYITSMRVSTLSVVEGGMWNFTRFPVLEELVLDARFFYRPPKQRWRMPFPGWQREAIASTPTRLRLIDALPDTIKTFRLLTETGDFQAYLVGDCLFSRWHIDGFKVSPEGRALTFTRDGRSSAWPGGRRQAAGRRTSRGNMGGRGGDVV